MAWVSLALLIAFAIAIGLIESGVVQLEEAPKAKNVKLIDWEMTSDAAGPIITGLVHNDSGAIADFITIEFTTQDVNGIHLGSVSDSTSNVLPETFWPFNIRLDERSAQATIVNFRRVIR